MKVTEDFFTKIATMLALPTIRKNIKKAEELLEDDVELQSAISNIKYNVGILDKQLPNFCKRHPESEICKEYKKKVK